MLLDSNVIIYITQKRDIGNILDDKVLFVSVITKLEVLGFHKILPEDKKSLEFFFETTKVLAITDTIIDLAIQLRQTRKISLGDSIIASTAIVNKLPLVTANTTDFKWIPELQLINPLE
jgi:toxin FitB